MRLMLMLGLFLALAACGGQAADPTTAPPTADTTDPTAQPPALTGRGFSMTFSGDVDATFPPGSATAELYDETIELFLGTLAQHVFFVLPADIGTGTHELEPRNEMDPNQGAAVEVSVAVDPDDFTQGIIDYHAEISGTLTLESVGQTWSGSFEFTAVSEASDDAEAGMITVSGRFNDLELLDQD